MCLVHRLANLLYHKCTNKVYDVPLQSKYGGHGFKNIPENIVPKMLEHSFCEEVVKMTTEDNLRAEMADLAIRNS